MSATIQGKIKEVTATSNPIIKDIKALALKKNRDREGLFLAEGLKLATDAMEAGWRLRTLIHGKKALEDNNLRDKVQALAIQARALGGDVLIVSDKILTSITRRDNAQMVVSVLEQRFTTPTDIKPVANDCWLALDRVRDPGNLGTIIRTADCLGAKGVILVGETTDPFALEAVRATMGSLFHVPLVRMSEEAFVGFAEKWREDFKGHVTGTHLKGAIDHRSIDYTNSPQLLLMGNEQQGLTDDLASACDRLALISMAGQADSLNLAVATGIMLFEARRHAL
ncbi:TrmH family RNA methyltransferase [Pseudahrensia aquimaris]|uniref:TrmH family RNA methyltransferase n=1 Tax=Pseudahrensia aquimaris TaxID=744461 RepID=A0ABW3FF23_9HYPH